MYLKQAVIENSGPLRWLNLSLKFNSVGLPRPLVLVGSNGSGKTNLLSLVVDALFEAAATHYENVLPTRGTARAWFRVVGGRTVTVGQPGSFCILRFDDEGTERFYTEKAGSIDPASVSSRLPSEVAGRASWPVDGSHKNFDIDDKRSHTIFEKNVFAYFPSSRSELPYWINREVVVPTEFDINQRFSKRLQKPIFIERALDQFKQWIIGLLTDTRGDIFKEPSDAAQDGWFFLEIQRTQYHR